jgi:hypothetical protein
MELKEKLDTFVERNFDSVSCMEMYNEFVEKLACAVKETNHELYHEFKEFIEESLEKIYYDQVERVLESLVRKDGQTGIKWSIEETNNISESWNLCKEDKLVFWYSMNKLFSSHYNPSFSLDFYIGLSKDMLHDEMTKEEIRLRDRKLDK